jgi:hypothetical protein
MEYGLFRRPVQWINEYLKMDPFGLVADDAEFPVDAEDAPAKLRGQADGRGFGKAQEFLKKEVGVPFARCPKAYMKYLHGAFLLIPAELDKSLR